MNTSARAVTASWRPRLPKAYGDRTYDRKCPEPRQGADPDERGARGTGETRLGHCMSHECRAAKHREEPDDAGNDGDHRGDDPGIGHEPGEHQSTPATGDNIGWARPPTPAGPSALETTRPRCLATFRLARSAAT